MFRDIKAISSDWMHQKYDHMRDFAWQSGYGVFSVSQSNAEQVETYIARQEEHHRGQTFEEEFMALLERHGIECERRYVFD